MAGYVYIMSNPVHSLIKIGSTEKDPQSRADELHSTNSPHKNVVEYWAIVNDCGTVEKKVHSLLNKYRVNQRREFFDIEVSAAADAIRSASQNTGGIIDDWVSKEVDGKIPTKKEWEAEERRKKDQEAFDKKELGQLAKDKEVKKQIYDDYKSAEYSKQKDIMFEKIDSNFFPLQLGGILFLIGLGSIFFQERPFSVVFMFLGLLVLMGSMRSRHKKKNLICADIIKNLMTYEEYLNTSEFRSSYAARRL